MKKINKTAKIIIIIIAVLAVAIIALRLFSGDEDTWLCENGQCVKHGQPIATCPCANK